MVNHTQVQRNKGEECSFIDWGAVVNSPLEETESLYSAVISLVMATSH